MQSSKVNELPSVKGWLGEVEGLRGVASLWVFAFHVAIACGASLPLVAEGGRGVDLFILISGFIMVHQFLRRKQDKLALSSSAMRRFWIRRFFRIAPLYYTVLLPALVCHHVSDAARDRLVSHFPTPMLGRHSNLSATNVVAHLTFVFGAIPHLASATPLPDWSIGLEMQFYILFPFVMLLIAKTGHRTAILCVSLIGMLASFWFHSYFGSFVMPACLPLRMYLFGMGMLIAARMHSATGPIWQLLVILPLCARLTVPHMNSRQACAQVLLAFVLYCVTTSNHVGVYRLLEPLRRCLRYSLCQRLGLISYSLYLVHLLIVFPLTVCLFRYAYYDNAPAIIRFALSFSINTCVVLPIAMLFYKYVETPGVQMSKWMIAQKPLSVQKSGAVEREA